MLLYSLRHLFKVHTKHTYGVHVSLSLRQHALFLYNEQGGYRATNSNIKVLPS